MEKHHAWLFVSHVLVDRDDVYFFFKKRSHRWLQFIFGHREISVDNSVVIASSKRGPRVHAHFLVNVYAMHRCRSAKGELEHPVFRFSLRSKDLVQRRSSNRTFVRQRRSAERFLGVRTCRSNLFGSVVNFSNRSSQFVDSSFAFDVHEINLGMIEEEMVMERSNVKTI